MGCFYFRIIVPEIERSVRVGLFSNGRDNCCADKTTGMVALPPDMFPIVP